MSAASGSADPHHVRRHFEKPAADWFPPLVLRRHAPAEVHHTLVTATVTATVTLLFVARKISLEDVLIKVVHVSVNLTTNCWIVGWT